MKFNYALLSVMSSVYATTDLPEVVANTSVQVAQKLIEEGYEVTDIFKGLVAQSQQEENGLNGASQRNLAIFTSGAYAQEGWRNLHKYGCWCNFENFKQGQGPVQDDYDSACKRLHDNYMCTIAESEAAGENFVCRPDKDQYVAHMLSGLVAIAVSWKVMGRPDKSLDTMNQAYQYCLDVNPNNVCMQGACRSEARFIYEVNSDINYFHVPENFPKDEFAHVDANGDIVFDFIGTCLTGGGNRPVAIEKTCCGNVPFAKVYNRAGSVGCCNDQDLFSTVTNCCSSDGVKAVGLC